MTQLPQLIVALDLAESRAIAPVVDSLSATVTWFKIGLELFCAEGPAALIPVMSHGRNVFLDLKLHDIPRTVERAVSAAARHGVQMLTVHASGGRAMLKAAADAAAPHNLKLLAVTALTSLDQNDLMDLGIERSPADHVLKMAEIALDSGIPGIVCSAHEVRNIRSHFGDEPILVTPGIRLPTDSAGDQKRVGSPRGAVRDGSNFLVVGRPILEAHDPRAAAEAILREMSDAHK
jgi:orotidine-5'-phosphate decarboxylase